MAMDRFSRRFPRIAAFFGFARRRRRPLTTLFFVIMHGIGFAMSISAIMGTRTPQGAIAWAVSLNTFPYVAVPAYWIFGDSEMEGYFDQRSKQTGAIRPAADKLISDIREAGLEPAETTQLMTTLSKVSSLPVTDGNRVELLVDGHNTFRSMFQAIESAEDYILIQFYIIKSDGVGNELKDRLIHKARQGVRVMVLYDDYGCLNLGGKYVSEMKDAGVEILSFMNLGGDVNRFQLNFRNHRKLVVIDGKTAFIGGHNVGDEYLGRHPVLTPWRDSHVRLTGPIATCLQVAFAEDWLWASGDLPEGLNWDIEQWQENPPGSAQTVCIPSGPGDELETCSMLFHSAMQSANERIWIASPYFVPDQAFVLALQLAALRGVQVRILIPELSDSKLPFLSSFSYLEELEAAGVEVWRYQKGFLHQKVMLVDDEFVAIGSANLDNRSFRLNFELMAGIHDRPFAKKVEDMLTTDFNNSRRAGVEDLQSKGFPFRVQVRVARLLAPIQ